MTAPLDDPSALTEAELEALVAELRARIEPLHERGDVEARRAIRRLSTQLSVLKFEIWLRQVRRWPSR